MVAGGFFDGNKVTTEPLGDVCLMLEDCTDRRVEKLTRMLYALAAGIKELKGYVFNSSLSLTHNSTPRFMTQSLPVIFPPSTPRVYRFCALHKESGSGQLAFTSKFENTAPKRMLFTASLSTPSSPSIPVVVKLVNGRYGEEVHKMLADHHLAPVLYGISVLEGAPKAYVMEYFDRSSWMTLSDYVKLPHSATAVDSIWLSITKVLEVLQKNHKVHGDLRAPNILVNVSLTGQLILVEDDSGIRKANIKVVDFDWAGDVGKVYYPPSRNPNIVGLTWPGKPGGLIKNGHDRKLVDSWWQVIFRL